jgi:murein DD-endopeptidase MepM/ murein hydrolase activator NlpD
VLANSLPSLAFGATAVALSVAVATGPPPTAPPSTNAVAPGWRWPVDPPQVLRGFDDVGRYEAGHRGVDLAAAAGQEVSAVAAGTVTFAGAVAGRGVVVVLHADGLRTTYEPVDPAVPTGASVTAGGVLGVLAPAPVHCAVSCLHLGLRDGDVYLDPLSRLRGDPPVLLPLGRP